MLEVFNLTKTYKSKQGVEVTAVNNINLKFNEKGMVFIVGKSGCGKSTLLNLLGGLDGYDSGNIVINGVSSANFKQADFDAYRNTYLGFIFQEYNLLKDFSVGANVGLALELQNKKATDEAVNAILESVDLKDYANRRINELSGGQKQRVAIARALVKDPEIILADEPSGALDSVSAKQIFDTLKKLSKTKLVIIVSHDMDFAARYGDRIIELKDGKVISDLTRTADGNAGEIGETENAVDEIVFDNDSIKVPPMYHLTEDDLKAINDYIESLGKGVSIDVVTTRKKDDGREQKAGTFVQTDTEKIVKTNEKEFKTIKSRLPLKTAFKMGASNLKVKRFKLIMTIFLSVIAFTMFGVYDTMASYKEKTAIINSICDNKVTSLCFEKISTVQTEEKNSNNKFYPYSTRIGLNDDDIEKFSKDCGVEAHGVCTTNITLEFQNVLSTSNFWWSQSFYQTSFKGVIEMTEEDVEKLGYTVVGKLPETFDEIVIPEFIARSFAFKDFPEIATGEWYYDSYSDVVNVEDMIGKTIDLGYYAETPVTVKVTGILRTGDNLEKYERLNEIRNSDKLAEQLEYSLLTNEFNDILSQSYNGMMIVKKGYLDNIGKTILESALNNASVRFEVDGIGFGYGVDLCQGVSDLSTLNEMVYIDGHTAGDFGDNNVIVSEGLYTQLLARCIDLGYTSFANLGMELCPDTDSWSISSPITVIGYEKSNTGRYVYFEKSAYTELAKSTYKKYTRAFFNVDSKKRTKIRDLIDYSYNNVLAENVSENEFEIKTETLKYDVTSYTISGISMVTEIFDVLKKVFFWIGFINAAFASLLLSNFITIGITNKKTDIGILRAVGARGADVFRVFFSESFIIAMINYVISCITTIAVTVFINFYAKYSFGALVTFVSFGIRQVIVLFVLCIAVAAIASFLPINKLARKKPIDVILNK